MNTYQRQVSAQDDRRSGARRSLALAGRLVWRDARGASRFASVTTRNVSDRGVFVDCESGSAIPLYRLVHFQIERSARADADLPVALREGKILSAVYRVGSQGRQSGVPQTYALRLLAEPGRQQSRRAYADRPRDEAHAAFCELSA